MPTPYTWSAAIDSTLTGDAGVDSLIIGSQWVSTNLTYSFPGWFATWSTDAVTGYPFSTDQEPFSAGYSPLGSSDITAVRTALASWASVSTLRFTQVSESSSVVGDLRFAYSDTVADAQAWAYSPGTTSYAGDVWFSSDGSSYTSYWTQGSYEYMTVIHEIGHALGLKHPFEVAESGGVVINGTVIDPALDSRSYTIMSYSADPGNIDTGFTYEPTTPMVLDIAAIQALYGANTATNAGNTSYVFQAGKSYHQTVWDAGGIDTFSYSSSVGGLIDLREGTDYGSRLGEAIWVYDINGNLLHEVNNLWIAYGTVIENAVGGSGNDQIFGNAVANTLNGGAGADTLAGGAGDDIYLIDHLADLVVEHPGEGTDLVRIAIATANATHTLADNVENAILLNTVAFNLVGNTLANTLTGNAAANTLEGGVEDDFLDGKGGVDRLVGGSGGDTYVVDQLADLVIENADEGIDLLLVAQAVSATRTLADNVENATLLNAVAFNLVGNGLNNTLTGNALANTLDGGAGDDFLVGGLGNDTYVLDSAGDSISDSGGIDTVVSSVDHSLGADFEHLTLTGAALTATGNMLANTLIGNALANTLDGGAGVDVLKGGAGDDTYVVDLTATNLLQDVLSENNGEGSDTVILRGGNTGLASTVTLTLGNHLDHLDASATGLTKLNLNGNTLNNTLIGNDAANTLNGGTGADVLEGGAGDDVYVLDSLADQVVENPGEGTDLVRVLIATANATHTLADNVENATLLSTVAFNLVGNSENNTLTGNAAANTLDGGAGDDFLVGGLGNDTYVLDSLGDSISDSGGSDTVFTSLDYSLAAGLEHLTLTGNGLTGQGNALANTLKSLAGDATLIGGLGNDSYFIGTGDSVVDSGGIDTVVSSADHSLGADFEHLTLTGAAVSATGNTLANTLIGNGLANTLDGGLGVDLLKGGAGDDTYVVDLTATNLLQDVLSENNGEGSDTVILRGGNTGLASTVTLTLGNHLDHLDASATGLTKLNLNGNTLNNTLIGNAAANTLDGKAGADVLEGGAGDDIYVLDSLADLVVENPGEGTDLVRITIATANATHTLAENVENAILLNSVAFNLLGNSGNNTLTGNGLANTLDGAGGNDLLDGKGGADRLIGGSGNDAYIVDHFSDAVIENGGEGTDTVGVAIASTGTHTLADNVENGVLINAFAFNLVGNGLANTLTGNAFGNTLQGGGGADVLDGAGGSDQLRGGTGDDLYRVDLTSANLLQDAVIENLDEGTDTIYLRGGNAALTTTATLSLGTHIENLDASATTSARIHLVGNALANTLVGNAAANTLNGGAGTDLLVGGAGDDTYGNSAKVSVVQRDLRK